MREIDTSKEAVNGTCKLLRVPQDLRHVRGEPLASLIKALAAERDAATERAERAEAEAHEAVCDIAGELGIEDPGCLDFTDVMSLAAALRARVAALEGALADAASSLEAIARDGGREGTFLDDYSQISGYAMNRAVVARGPLSAPPAPASEEEGE